MKVTVDNFADAVKDILDEYAKDIADGTGEAVEEVSKKGAQALNSASGSIAKGKKYRRSWKAQVSRGRLNTKAVLHSTIPKLPHLLEYDHATGRHRKGKYTGRPHIKPVEEELNRALENSIVKYIQKH